MADLGSLDVLANTGSPDSVSNEDRDPPQLGEGTMGVVSRARAPLSRTGDESQQEQSGEV
jgi:hypothetical protein